MKTISVTITFLLLMTAAFAQSYTMPHENELHEGTWLQWPHQYEYGITYRNSLDNTWVAMTAALLVGSEKVHIVAYDLTEKNRIINLLTNAGVSLNNVDFYLHKTNDVWVRDNGPIFVRDNNGELKLEDWGFNGWGGKFNYDFCDPIPSLIGTDINIPVIDLNQTMTNEGGAVELDGNGVLMACKSSVISQSPANSVRNPGMTQAQAESIFSQYLGVNKFIWLDGNVGEPSDITDFHIDGFAKFVNDSLLVTMNTADLTYWGVSANDIATLNAASNINNEVYTKVIIPLTQNNVLTTAMDDLGYKGSYVNYYVANTVVLVPNYNDPNDAIANAIIEALYPGRTVVGIDVRNLYENGGMVHCVTQQQPVGMIMGLNESKQENATELTVFPNPAVTEIVAQIQIPVNDATIRIETITGELVKEFNHIHEQQFVIPINFLPEGCYFIRLVMDGVQNSVKKLEVVN